MKIDTSISNEESSRDLSFSGVGDSDDKIHPVKKVSLVSFL